MNLKDKWIHDIETSMEGMAKPVVNPYLYNKVLNRLKNNELQVKPTFIWISAVTFIALILLNILVFNIQNHSKSLDSDVKQLSKAFHLINENNVNYN